MGNKNSGKAKLFTRIKYLFKGRFDMSEQTKESATVRVLRAQLNSFEKLINKQNEMIESLTDQLSIQNQGSTQDKVLEMVAQIFMPNQRKTMPHIAPSVQPDPSQQTLLPQSVELSDDNIQKILGKYQPNLIKGALVMGENTLISKIKQHYPELGDQTVLRAIELAKEI